MAVNNILRVAAPLDGPRIIPRRLSARRGETRAAPGSFFDRALFPFVIVAALLLAANILMAMQLRGRGEEATLFPMLGAAGMPLFRSQDCRSADAKVSAPRLVRADLVRLAEQQIEVCRQSALSTSSTRSKWAPAPQRVIDRTIVGKIPDAVIRDVVVNPVFERSGHRTD